MAEFENQEVPVERCNSVHGVSVDSINAENVSSKLPKETTKTNTNAVESDSHSFANNAHSSIKLGGTNREKHASDERFHAEVQIQNKIPAEIETVLKFICAFLNAKDAANHELIIKNKNHKSAKTKDMDEWYDRIEKKIKQYFFADNSSDFVRLIGNCNSEFFTISVKPAQTICTLDIYLYITSVSSVDQVKFDKAINIMKNVGHPSTLPIAKKGDYFYKRIVEDLRGENINIQFKEITGKNVPRTLADMSAKYISAFANNMGGLIYFGIEDKQATVVGVDITATTEEEIVNALHGRIQNMIWGNGESSIERQKHWNIDFCPIDGLPEELQNKRKVIVLSVATLPGGVFTAEPESYYLTETGSVEKYSYKEWRLEMLSSFARLPATKGDIQRLYEQFRQLRTEEQDIKTNVSGKTTEKVSTNIREWQLVKVPIRTESSTRLLEENIKRKRCVILKGLIGTGKSELALRYCYNKCMEEKSCFVWMLRCTNLSSLEESLRDLIKHLTNRDIGIDKREQHSQDEIIKLLTCKIVEILIETRQETNHIFLCDDVKQQAKECVDEFLNKCSRIFNIKLIVTSTLAFENDDDISIIEIFGFSLEEAVLFLREGNETVSERPIYEELARKFSCNPKGLQIARMYMKHNRLRPRGLLERLKVPQNVLKIEKSLSLKNKIEDDKLFTSLLSIISAIHKECTDSGKGEVFEMILMLPLMQVENIPVIIFSNLHPDSPGDLDADDLLHEVQNCSFGRVDGDDNGRCDNRLLSTHDVVVLSLEIYFEQAKLLIQVSKQDLLKRLLGSFFLLMDKDNRDNFVLQNHTLLLPHAKSVIEQLNIMIGKETSLWLTQTDIILKMIYVNDLVGFTSGFNETYRDSDKFFDQAKHLLFCLINVDENLYDQELLACCKAMSDISGIEHIAKKQSEILQMAMNTTAHIAHMRDSFQKTAKQFLLGKRRNTADLKLLQSKLKQENLANRTKLSEDEYENLCKQGNAIPEVNLGVCFFYELVTSVLYTYGRRLFYLHEHCDSTTARFFCSYLFIARELKPIFLNKETKNIETNISHQRHRYSFLTSVLTERSVIQAIMDPGLGFKITNIELLKKNLELCKARFVEHEKYLEFGTLKSSPEDNDYSRVLWLKQITRIYQILMKTNSELLAEGKQWGEQLSTFVPKMRNSTAYPSLVLTLGELYDVFGENTKALKCFGELLPKYSEQHEVVHLNKYQRRACINLLKCRIAEPKENSYDQETMALIQVYRIGLQNQEGLLQELDKLEHKLKIKTAC